MKRDIDILFVLIDVGFTLENSSVFQSQVGNQMLNLKDLGYEVGIISSYKNRDLFDQKIGNKLKLNGIKLFLVKKNFFLFELLTMIFTLTSLLFKYDIKNYYCRSFWGAIVTKFSLFYKFKNLVYDVRADALDEYRSVNMKKWKIFIYMFLENWGIKNSSTVLAVSKPLAQTVKKRFNISKVYTIPCCIDSKEFEVNKEEISALKNKLNFKDSDIVFVYSGGLGHYQKIPLLLEIWKYFLKYDFIKFLFLTNQDPRKHPTTFNEINSFDDRLIHLSLDRKDVPKYLNCADIGFMLRDSRDLNKAASPVKFPEYLACNLKVVASPGIGDVSDCIIKNDCGILIDTLSVDDGVKDLQSLVFNLLENKNTNNKIPLENYFWQNYSETYKEIYN